jgi:hypothetical protein
MAQLLGLCRGAYRPQRRWAVDSLEDGYLKRVPEEAQEWMEGFLREYYACDASRLRAGLHADRLKPEHLKRLPPALRAQLEAPGPVDRAALKKAMRLLGLKEKDLDSSKRREAYMDQNRANRCVLSLNRAEYFEDWDEARQEARGL